MVSNTFPGYVTRHCGNVEWPARNLDKLDFFLLRYLKEKMHARKPSDVNSLEAIIWEESGGPKKMFVKTAWNDKPYLEKCAANASA